MFQDLSAFGFPARSNNPALESFLQALPLSMWLCSSMSDSDRGYRQSQVSGFAQDFLRVSRRLTLNAGLRYDFYSNPSEAHGRLSAIRNPATDSGPTVGKVLPGHLWIFCRHRPALHGTSSVMVRLCCGRNRHLSRSVACTLFGVDRLLPPFFGIDSFVFPSFLNRRMLS